MFAGYIKIYRIMIITVIVRFVAFIIVGALSKVLSQFR